MAEYEWNRESERVNTKYVIQYAMKKILFEERKDILYRVNTSKNFE